MPYDTHYPINTPYDTHHIERTNLRSFLLDFVERTSSTSTGNTNNNVVVNKSSFDLFSSWLVND